MPATRRFLQCVAQLRKAEHLRRQRPPQAGAIHGGDVVSQFAFDGVDDGRREHGAARQAPHGPALVRRSSASSKAPKSAPLKQGRAAS